MSLEETRPAAGGRPRQAGESTPPLLGSHTLFLLSEKHLSLWPGVREKHTEPLLPSDKNK